jgi:hypothetical protein
LSRQKGSRADSATEIAFGPAIRGLIAIEFLNMCVDSVDVDDMGGLAAFPRITRNNGASR